MSTDYGRLSKNEFAADVGNAIDTLGANNYAQCADIMKFLFDEIPHATAQAVAIEREAIAGWHDAQSEQLTVAADGLSVSASIGRLDDRSARILKAMREAAGGHKFAAQAIRNGEHVKP